MYTNQREQSEKHRAHGNALCFKPDEFENAVFRADENVLQTEVFENDDVTIIT